MASKETLGRVRHFDLISHQLRIRHLRSISVRNLIPKFEVTGECMLNHFLETYFTLHSVTGNQNAFYTSEKIKLTLNPTWTSFDRTSWAEQHSSAGTSFTIKIWGGQANKFRLMIEWQVHLPSLQFLGEQVKSGKYGHNTIIFGLIGGYYGAVAIHELNELSEGLQKKEYIKVDLDQVQTSYKLPSVRRLQMMQKAIQQSQLSVKCLCQSIQTRVESDLKYTSQLSEEEMLKLKIKLLREELISKQKLLFQERKQEQGILTKLEAKEIHLSSKRKQLSMDQSSFREHKKLHIERRESLVKLNAQLNIRRRQLVSELMSIYPITELQSSKEYVICGVRLPNCESDEFTAMDDETLSVALGYACHLVSMIARFLELPLRYPVNYTGSRSTVNDFTIEKVPEKDRKFPLYSKGKEGTKFFYGAFLLNKDIAQIRQYNGLGTPNLRYTLPNLKDLLDSKFRSSDPLKSAPLTIIRKTPLKNQKVRTSVAESAELPLSNPKLDYVLLKSMNVSAPDGKPDVSCQPKPVYLDEPEKSSLLDQPAIEHHSGLLPEPVLLDEEKASSSTKNSIQLVKPALPPKPDLLNEGNQTENSLLIDQEENATLLGLQTKPVLLADLNAALYLETVNKFDSQGQNKFQGVFDNKEQRSVSLDGALYVPPLGTGHGFLEQKRTKRKNKPQENAARIVQPQGTSSLKSCKPGALSEHMTGTNDKNDLVLNCAEKRKNNTINSQESHGKVKKEDFVDLRQVSDDVESPAQKQHNERTALLAVPKASNKHFQPRSKTLFDEEGAIDFHVCENGELDLR